MPEITFEKHALIFDYKTETEIADVRLAVFLKMKSDVRRVKKMELLSLQNDCVWTVDNPIVFAERSGEEWAGTNNIVQHSAFDLSGDYVVKIFDAHDEETEKIFSVSFPNFLKSANAKTAKEKLREAAKLQTAFFDGDGRLLFLGQAEDFANKNEDFSYRRDCLFAENIVCIMPVIENETKNALMKRRHASGEKTFSENDKKNTETEKE